MLLVVENLGSRCEVDCASDVSSDSDLGECLVVSLVSVLDLWACECAVWTSVLDLVSGVDSEIVCVCIVCCVYV